MGLPTVTFRDVEDARGRAVRTRRRADVRRYVACRNAYHAETLRRFRDIEAGVEADLGRHSPTRK